MTRALHGVAERSNNVLSDPLVSVLDVPSGKVLSESLSGDGHDGSVDESLLVEVGEDAWRKGERIS